MSDPDPLIGVLNDLFGQDPNLDKVLTNLNPDYGYGQRGDGTNKGRGYFGPLSRKDGAISTELSIGTNIDGKEQEIPLLVPTLTQDEIGTVLNSKSPKDIPRGIIQKAQDHASMRIKSGKSPFAGMGEDRNKQ